jgi:hypothetical protein
MHGSARQNDRGGDGRKLRGFAASDASYERTGLVPILSSLLGELDFSAGPYSEEAENVASFMKSYFSQERRRACEFMIEPSFAAAIQEEAAPVNPLLGNYAHGRTGRTPRDPLRGFAVLKLEKGGKPKARLIKPGKKTPYVTVDHETVSPYDYGEAEQFKLPMKPNGRYRHIASYSLEELIDMGWDGAKYNSSTQGAWVPYVPGYDSDPDDEYERVNIAHGKRQGLIGLTEEDIGLCMDVSGQGMVKLCRDI